MHRQLRNNRPRATHEARNAAGPARAVGGEGESLSRAADHRSRTGQRERGQCSSCGGMEGDGATRWVSRIAIISYGEQDRLRAAGRAPPGPRDNPWSGAQLGQATTPEMARNHRTSPRTERGGLEGRSLGANARLRDLAPAQCAPPPRPRPICVGLWGHPTPAQNLCEHPSPPLLRDQRRRAARREVRSARYAPSSAPTRSSWRGRCLSLIHI